MEIFLEYGKWFTSFGGNITPLDDFLGSTVNSGNIKVLYTIAPDPNDPNCFLIQKIGNEPRVCLFKINVFDYPESYIVLRFTDIKDDQLAKDLKEKLVVLGFNHVLLAPSVETLKRIAKHFGN